VKKMIFVFVAIFLLSPHLSYAGGPPMLNGKLANVNVQDDSLTFDFTGSIGFGPLTTKGRQWTTWKVENFPILIKAWRGTEIEGEIYETQPQVKTFEEATALVRQSEKEGQEVQFFICIPKLFFDTAGKLIKIEGMGIILTTHGISIHRK